MSAQIKEALATIWRCLRTGNIDGSGMAMRVVEAALEAAQQEAEACGWVKARIAIPAEGQPVIFHHHGHVDGHVELGCFLDGDFVAKDGERYSPRQIWVWKDATCPKVPAL